MQVPIRMAVLLFVETVLCAQTVPRNINATVKKIVDEVSEQNIVATLNKLESFETRNTFSATDDPEHGIGAARKWIYDQFRSYSPKLEVYYDTYKVKKQPRVFRDVDVVNVVAVLPGTTNKDRQVIISAHYDSLNRIAKPGTPEPGEQPEVDEEKTVAARAPGVTDDGSGTAAVMELARIMSQYQFEKTIVFVTFAGEEQALIGSSPFAVKAQKEKRQIEGVLNNDIIGSEVSGNGRSDNNTVRVFSPEPRDSISRELARYVKTAGERYVTSMKLDLIFREDRFARGGDHMPFIEHGFPAVRITTSSENYANQHTAADTFANTSPGYVTRVTKVNGAALASLALAPKPPVTTRVIKTGANKGKLAPNLARGKSRYDAVLKWTDDNPELDLLGFTVVYRSTRAPFWENEIYVGNVKEFTLENVSIDEYVFGVKAIDKDGNESLVAAYQDGSLPRREIETY
jgi:Zn-dependent M28 family amino/carboxypeptidase